MCYRTDRNLLNQVTFLIKFNYEYKNGNPIISRLYQCWTMQKRIKMTVDEINKTKQNTIIADQNIF